MESFPTEKDAIRLVVVVLVKWTSASRGVIKELTPLGLALPEEQLDLEA